MYCLTLLTTLDPEVSSTPSVTDNHQTQSDIEKSVPDVDDASVHTDKRTSPQPLVSDNPPRGEDREKGGDDNVNNLEQTNKDL